MCASMRLSAVLAAALLLAVEARAQSPAEFYRGKTVELDIGSSVGGGYDAYRRMIAAISANEAAKAGLEISPAPGAETEHLVQELYRTPEEIARKAADLSR